MYESVTEPSNPNHAPCHCREEKTLKSRIFCFKMKTTATAASGSVVEGVLTFCLYSFKGTNLPKTCFVQKQIAETELKLKVEDCVRKCSLDFIINAKRTFVCDAERDCLHTGVLPRSCCTNRLSDIGHGSCLLTSPESQGQRETGNVQPVVTQ